MTTTEGPYYKPGAPQRKNNTICEWHEHENGTQLYVHGLVYDDDCKTGIQALLDVWSADPDGDYSPLTGPDYTCRGKIMTDKEGDFEFYTTVPGAYEQDGMLRPAHIHYKVTPVRGDNNKTLTLQQYFDDDPYFKDDPCPEPDCHAGDPTLTVPMQSVMKGKDQSFMAKFDIYLR